MTIPAALAINASHGDVIAVSKETAPTPHMVLKTSAANPESDFRTAVVSGSSLDTSQILTGTSSSEMLVGIRAIVQPGQYGT